jgi:hypothetical protein
MSTRLAWPSLALMLTAAVARAEDARPLAQAIAAAKPIANARLRFEGVHQDPLARDAEAMTLRARLGFETGSAWQTTLIAEGDFTWPLRGDYNDTVSGHTGYPVVADPESHALNRLQLTNTSIPGTTLTVGRQRIALDDHRFVGNVGWRQHEQTFDSVRIVNTSVTNLTLDAAYVDQVNRVFGERSPQGSYRSDSVLANASYRFAAGKLTAFGYRLAFEPDAQVPAAVRDSSMTFGVRFTGERPMQALKLAYALSYANQRESGDNPLSFDLDYYLAEFGASYTRYNVAAGLEVLEGNGAKGFTTPLATLHKFQGWADKFLTTPGDGVEDRYLNASVTLPALLEPLTLVASHHWYRSQHGGSAYGSELDVQLEAKWQRFSGLIKYAAYDADALFTDTTKYWVQVEYAW